MRGIYKITSPSGRVYIGQSVDIHARWKSHLKGHSRCHALYNSFKKYGFDAHKFEVIHELPTDVSSEVLNEYEILYIDLYISCGCKMANIKKGGMGGGKGANVSQKVIDTIRRNATGNTYRKGVKLSPETIEKMKKALKGKKAWNKGIPLSDEQKVHLSIINKGKVLSQEVRKKISTGLKGRIVSQETRDKIGEAHKGKTLTIEQIERLKIVNTGKKHTNETKNKMRLSHKGRPKSKESIQKRTATRKIKNEIKKNVQ